MFTETIAKIDALRGQEQIEPHQLLDTIKDALGQCQAFLQQRGPVQIGINGSEYESRGYNGFKLPQHNFPGARAQSDLSGLTDYSFLPMFNPSLGASVNGFYHPLYGFPLMFPTGVPSQWNPQDIFGPLMVFNPLSYFELPANWDVGIDARQGAIHNAMAGFFQGVTVFSPINIHNNPQHNNNQVCQINHGDVIMRNLFADQDIFVNRNVFIGGDVDVDGDTNVDGDLTVTNLYVTDTVDLTEAELDLSGISGYGNNMILTTDESGELKWRSIVDVLTLLTGWNINNNQSIGHDSSESPEWQDDGECD